MLDTVVISVEDVCCRVVVGTSNIEGLSVVKAFMLSDLFKDQYCHCLCPQETHRGTRKSRHIIPEMTFVKERPYDKYGSAIFIRDYRKVKGISVTAANYVEVFTTELPDVVIQFVFPPLGHRSLPRIVIGYLNSHNIICGNNATDNNGVAVGIKTNTPQTNVPGCDI